MTRERSFEPELSPGIREKLRAANAVDFALLDWAHKRFCGRRAASCNAFTRSSKNRVAAAKGVNFGTREIEILAAECRTIEADTVPPCPLMSVRLTCRSKIFERDLTVGVAIRDCDGNTVGGANTRTLKIPVVIPVPQDFLVHIGFNPAFPAGDYSVTFALHKGNTHLDRCYHWFDNAVQFSVAPGRDGDGDIGITIAVEASRHGFAKARWFSTKRQFFSEKAKNFYHQASKWKRPR